MQHSIHIQSGLGYLVDYINTKSADFNSLFKETQLQELTLQTLGTEGVSNLTQHFLTLRTDDPGLHDNVKLIEAKLQDGDLTTFFNVTPTNGGTATVLTPQGRSYPGSFYNVIFHFSDVAQFTGTIEEFKQLNPTDQLTALSKVAWQCDVRVYSNDGSFYFQGAWEDLDAHGAAYFKFPGPKGDGVWRQRHNLSGGLGNAEIRVTKHMAQIIADLNSFLPFIRDWIIK